MNEITHVHIGSIIGSAPVLVTLAHLYKTRLINADTHLISLEVKIILSSSLPRIRGTHSNEKGHITHLPPLCEIAVSSHVESKVQCPMQNGKITLSRFILFLHKM